MELVEGDLFQMADQAIAFISRHLNHGAGVHSHGAAADDVDEIPNSVIAEAVNNAIAHRNYASIGSIQVEVYSDRVEVISPGRLHRAISVADLYRKHESHAVNPRIARAMYQVKYIETMGTGLTDLLDACKANGLKRPLLEEVPSGFRIVIWRPAPATNGGDNRGGNRGGNSVAAIPNEQRRICEILIENPKIAIRKIASTLDVRPRTVEKQIAALKAKGVLSREGGTRGFWKVTLRKEG
jgi:predicted HTH transcriptional regulator